MAKNPEITITLGGDLSGLKGVLQESKTLVKTAVDNINKSLANLKSVGGSFSGKGDIAAIRKQIKTIQDEFQNLIKKPAMASAYASDPHLKAYLNSRIKDFDSYLKKLQAIRTKINREVNAVKNPTVTPPSYTKITPDSMDLASPAYVKTVAANVNFIRGKIKELDTTLTYLRSRKKGFVPDEDIKSVEDLGHMINTVTAQKDEYVRRLDGIRQGFRNLGTGIRGILNDIKDLAMWQARWYLAKGSIFAVWEGTIGFERTAIQYAKVLDDWTAQFLRWEATSGKVKDSTKVVVASIIKDIRQLSIDVPLSFEEIAKSAEGFIGAGVAYPVVKELLPAIAKLKAAFPEIDMEKFGVAITGAWNSFRGTIKGATDDVEEFTRIMEQMMYAQARGIIRPEQFPQILQHLGEMARISGFASEEMFSLAVVVTDLGSRAGSAARSLRGMIETFQKPKNLAFLRDLGVVIKDDLTFAEQFTSIMTQLRDIVGTGPKSVKAVSLLSELLPVERVKSASAVMDFLDKYLRLNKEMLAAQGAIDAANELMAQRVSGQLVILKNRYTEFAHSVSSSSGFVKEFIYLANDILLGALLAVDNETVVLTHSFNELGATAMIVYGIVKGFANTVDFLVMSVSKLQEVIRPLAYAFDIIGISAEHLSAVLTQLVQIITLLVLYKGAVRFGAFIIGLKGAEGAAASLGTVIQGLGAKFVGLASKIALPLYILYSLISAYEELKNKEKGEKAALGMGPMLNKLLDKVEVEAGSDIPKAIDAKIKTLGIVQGRMETLQQNLMTLEDALKENEAKKTAPITTEMLQNPEAYKPLEEGTEKEIRKNILRITKDLDLLKSKEIQLQNAIKDTEKEGLKTPADVFKYRVTDYNKAYQLAKDNAAREIKLLKQKNAELLAIEEARHAAGETSVKDYADKRLSIVVDEIEKEKAKEEELLLSLTSGKLFQDYKKALGVKDDKGKGLSPDEKLNIEEQYNQRVLQAKAAISTFEHNLAMERIKINKEIYQKHLSQAKEFLSAEAAVKESAIQEELNRTQWSLDEQAKQRDYFYENSMATVQDYYKWEKEKAADLRDAKLKQAQDTYNNWVKYEKQRITLLEDNSDAWLAFNNEDKKRLATLQNEKLQIMRDYYSSIIEINNSVAQNVKDMWLGEDGAINVTAKALKDLSKEYKTFGEQWYDVAKGTAQSSTDALETFFFDAMEDDLKTAYDYWKLFAQGVEKLLADLLAKQFMQQIMGFDLNTGKATGGGLFSWFGGGSAGQTYSIGGDWGTWGGTYGDYSYIAHQGGMVDYLPRLHLGGLFPDERLIVGQKGEGVVSRRGMYALDQINKGNTTGISPRTVTGGDTTDTTATVFQVTINAVDAKSFSELCQKNSNAISAAVTKVLKSNDPALRSTLKRTL